MSGNILQICSVIAAVAAAVAAFLMAWTQHRNLLEASRPVLILSEWDRGEPDSPYVVPFDGVWFGAIRNVGRGVARRIEVNCDERDGNGHTAIMSASHIPILAPNEEVRPVGQQIALIWRNVSGFGDGPKELGVRVVIVCWDSRGMRHETRYLLVVSESCRAIVAPDGIAPGVRLLSYTTTEGLVWRHRLRVKTRKLLGELFTLLGYMFECWTRKA